jgi:3-hydroxyacyl-CoA dehydrogenase
MNVLDDDIFKIANVAVDRLYGDAIGLVIGNEGDNFSAGANLLKFAILAQSGQWNEIGMMLKGGQDTMMALRKAPKPVVAAPFSLALGGGVEICLAADRIVAAAESYMGLVEVGVGIIPSWGGCKEMVRRHVSPHMHATNVNPMPYLRRIFETIGFAKVSTSAEEARQLGFLADDDRIVMNREHQLAEAKREVLEMVEAGYRPPVTTGNVYAAGRDHYASVKIETYSMVQAGYISEHDAIIANQLGYVLAGGDLSEPAWMDEQYFLDLEMEAVLTLASTPKTQERVMHMLQSGKPLRN